jgi:hypothetical protein
MLGGYRKRHGLPSNFEGSAKSPGGLNSLGLAFDNCLSPEGGETGQRVKITGLSWTGANLEVSVVPKPLHESLALFFYQVK